MQENPMEKVVVESRLVHSLFKCSLCHGLIRSATVINECLHRFCKLCITNYFEKANQEKCPTCHIVISNPMETLKSDLTFQRLLYKLFPSVFQREITCKPSLLSSTLTNESTRIHIDTTIDVYLEYWDISLDLFPSKDSSSATSLSPCYLECIAGTPLALLEKFIRVKHSLPSNLQIDLFYEKFLLNKDHERLIDICYCFDHINKNQTLNLRFLVSPYGYKAILNHIRRSKQPIPPEIEVTESPPLEVDVVDKTSPPMPSSSPSSSSCDSASIDPKLKLKIRRTQNTTNDWVISQSTATTITTTTTTTTSGSTNIVAPATKPVGLPDLVNSCETVEKTLKRREVPASTTPTSNKKKPCNTATFFSPGHISQPTRTSTTKPRNKPRRRIRFIPTMVPGPPSILDRMSMDEYDYSDPDTDHSPICSSNEHRDHSVTTLRPPEMIIVNVEGNVSDTSESKRTQKTICKVPPYIPETSPIITSPPEKSSSVTKSSNVYPTLSSIRRTLLPKRISSLIPSLSNRTSTASSDPYETTPLDLSLK